MNTKFLIKIVIDIGMMACLLLLMPYSLLGETAHEWIGMGMLVLFLLHHWFNRKWLSAVNRGAYSPLPASSDSTGNRNAASDGRFHG